MVNTDVLEKNYVVPELSFIDRKTGTEALDTMQVIIDHYGIATVSDLFESLGLHGNYGHDKWGWDSLEGFKITEAGIGYMFEYPPVKPTVAVFDKVDENIAMLMEKTGLTKRTLKELLSRGYSFISEVKKADRFERNI